MVVQKNYYSKSNKKNHFVEIYSRKMVHLKSYMVRQAGVEPATLRFEV